ncbi:MAG TPA: hypothetical protein VLB84_14520, partial [Bacteroidia bacterium]|nr:hypothetical protein [Bacteroidia bacterium]
MTNQIYFFIIILIGLSKVGESQSWYSFSTKLAIDKYIGSQFRLEASVRANIEDESASARIWLRIDDVNGNNAFLENMWNKPIRNA